MVEGVDIRDGVVNEDIVEGVEREGVEREGVDLLEGPVNEDIREGVEREGVEREGVELRERLFFEEGGIFDARDKGDIFLELLFNLESLSSS
jgi:hypothetical protein